MHACFINMPIEYYSPVSGGAVATALMQTARALIDRGHRVSVLTPVNGDETYHVGEVLPIETRSRNDLAFLQRRLSSLKGQISGWDWPYFDYYLRSVASLLKKLLPAPDLIVLFNDLASSAVIKRLLPKTKVVVWLQNEWRTRHNIAETIRHTDLFITCSGYIREWTARTHQIPLDRIRVSYNAADHTAFIPRADFLSDTEALRVLFVGRIDPNKGPDIAADAVAALQAEGLPVTLTVAGGLWFYGHGNEMADPYFRLLRTKMESISANYVGYVTRRDIPALYRQHDVVCVLSRSQEPFALTVMEAMASGCAVVASNRGGIPEACDGAGILVEPQELETVVTALRKLATNPAALRFQKAHSIERAARISWADCALTLESALA